jgi:hypothetical protein
MFKIKSFKQFLNEFEIEGEHHGKPLWNGKDYLDSDGDINLYNKNLTELPCIFPEIMNTNVYFHNNNLTSLEGCPQHINGYFDAKFNLLTSLKDGPKYVRGGYIVSHNEITSMEGLPSIINGDLYIQYNELESLDYLPKEIKGNLYIYGNDKLYENMDEEELEDTIKSISVRYIKIN